MDERQARDRLAELRREIHYHDHQYYVLDDPVIPDIEYDRLFRELLTLEEQFPELVTADSPSRRVGGEPLTSFEEVEHPFSVDRYHNGRRLKVGDSVGTTTITIEFWPRRLREPKPVATSTLALSESGDRALFYSPRSSSGSKSLVSLPNCSHKR